VTAQQPLTCPYCNTPAKCVDSKIIYGRSYGPAWVCGRFPECDSYCGCHPGTKTPLGTLANKELRSWRMKVHKCFDKLWRGGALSRKEAYRGLAARMGLSKDECHISMFTIAQCEQAIEVVKQTMEPA
jgi:hypothetical protein